MTMFIVTDGGSGCEQDSDSLVEWH